MISEEGITSISYSIAGTRLVLEVFNLISLDTQNAAYNS